MALVGESTPERYFNERGICRQHQILGHIDAPLHQPTMWRNSGAASKCFSKVVDGKLALAGNLPHRELSFKISVDRISRKPQLPWRQPSTHQGSRKMHAAKYACEMYIQRGRDLVNKLVVDAVLPIDSRYQTVPKVQNDGVVGRNTGPYCKLHDSIGAVIVSKLIESGSRNEKAKAVGLVFGTGCRIESQVDEANRAIWKGDYLEAGFWCASAEDIPLQGQDESSLR
jgi:hypothetical protein